MRSAETTYRFSTPEVTVTPFIAFFCEVVLCLTARRYWVSPSVTRAKLGVFRLIMAEVLFLDMDPDEDGEYEPLVGYIVLEQAGAAVSRR